MKKIFMLALAAMTLTVVSCKKDSAAAGKDSTEKKALSVEEQTEKYCKDLLEAMKSGDEEKANKIEEEAMKWEDSLSEEDQDKVDEARRKFMENHMDEIEKARAAAQRKAQEVEEAMPSMEADYNFEEAPAMPAADFDEDDDY